MMKIPIYQIDAFTKEIFRGNPAAVCPLDEWLPEELMQKIAAENNLSETAFYTRSGNGYELRWFTPKVEVDLCGHATLATAHVIFNYYEKELQKIDFYTKSGKLTVSREGSLIVMDFPSRPPAATEVPKQLLEGLVDKPEQVLKSRDYFVVYESQDQIERLQPKFDLLAQVDGTGIIVTAKGKEADFVSRFFAPQSGIDEDPVTGSAHCTLIPYWAEKLGKTSFRAIQLSQRRGELLCQLLGDRVSIAGNSATYLHGEIEV